MGTPFSPLLLQGEAQADLLLVFQDGIVGLVDVLGHFGSSALQGELQGGEERLAVAQRKAAASSWFIKGNWKCLSTGWRDQLWLVMVTQNTSPGCCFVTNTQLSSQSLLQAGGGM